MKKHFNAWNRHKKWIDSHKDNKLYNEQEVWWCALGVNIGFVEASVFNGIRKAVRNLF